MNVCQLALHKICFLLGNHGRMNYVKYCKYLTTQIPKESTQKANNSLGTKCEAN